MIDFLLKKRSALRVGQVGFIVHSQLRLIGFRVLNASTFAPQLLLGKMFRAAVFVDELRLTRREADGGDSRRNFGDFCALVEFWRGGFPVRPTAAYANR